MAGPRNRPTAKPTAESGEGRGLEGDGEVQVFSNLLISICVYVGSNPTLSATLRAFLVTKRRSQARANRTRLAPPCKHDLALVPWRDTAPGRPL